MTAGFDPTAEVAPPRRILVVGSGGREHALVWSLARERDVEEVLAAPGSDAIAMEPKARCVPAVAATDANAIAALARDEAIDLVVVGPEAAIAAGVTDACEAAGIPVFGPTAAAGEIESSKSFCRSVAEAANVRMAQGASFDRLEPALAYAREIAGAAGSCGVVVKADGLMAGKGVTVCDDFETAERAIRALFAAGSGAEGSGTSGSGAAGAPSTTVVIEERLFGAEASLIAICDGHQALALPAARDHKRLRNADEGPNTGGMGAYSPVPDLPAGLCATLIDVVHLPILAELMRRGRPFRGALYAGLILTPEGPALLECNARFGDPEAQAILPRLDVPLGPLLAGAARGDLAAAAAALGLHGPLLPTTGDAAVAVVLAAEGYPESPRRGDAIEGLPEAAAGGAILFHAGSRRDEDGTFRTNGGRVLAVVGLAGSLPAARDRAERAADRVSWQGMQRRNDIAARLPGGGAAAETTPEGYAPAEAGGGS